MAIYTQGEQIHLAPTEDSGERWLASMRHIATEGRMWVVSVGTFLRESDLPRDLAALGVYAPGELIHPGESIIVSPLRTILACPSHCGERILLPVASP